jgi:Xaa-Pro aminopeptidase
MSMFRSRAAEILSHFDTIWTTPSSKIINETLASLFPEDKAPVIKDIRKNLNDMRIIKDSHEITLLKRAAIVTAEAQRQAMMLAAPGRFEYELEAAIEHTFRSEGCDGPGFNTIIGSGSNSTILHYDLNSRRLEAGDVIVMDIGAKCRGYTADVTRTIPASGRFTPEQLEIYNIVLEAQKEAIREMMPGKRSLAAHDRATEVIMEGLRRLGLVTDPSSPWQKKLYILYTCTHHIGLDVHDTYPYQLTPYDEGILSPGMVITIEPGIYMSPDMLNNLREQYRGKSGEEEITAFISQITPLFEKYKNTGVRIEDDILITEEGNIVLSEAAPREPAEIERLMKKRSRYE